MEARSEEHSTKNDVQAAPPINTNWCPYDGEVSDEVKMILEHNTLDPQQFLSDDAMIHIWYCGGVFFGAKI